MPPVSCRISLLVLVALLLGGAPLLAGEADDPAPSTPADGGILLENDYAQVVIDAGQRASIRYFRLKSHGPIDLPDHYTKGGGPTNSHPSHLDVLGEFHPTGPRHNWLQGWGLPRAWQAWTVADGGTGGRTVTLACEREGLRYELTYELAADKPDLACRLRIVNPGDTERDLGQPRLFPINGVHQDVGRNELRWACVVVHRDGEDGGLDSDSFPEERDDPDTQRRENQGETYPQGDSLDYIAIKSRFFAALWEPGELRVAAARTGESDREAEPVTAGPTDAGGPGGGPADGATPVQAATDDRHYFKATTFGYPVAPQSGNPLSQCFLQVTWFSRNETSTVVLGPGEELSCDWHLVVTSMSEVDLATLTPVEGRIEYTSAFHRFFRVLSDVMTWILRLIGPLTGYGLAVMLITLLLKLVIHRFMYKQQVSMRKMQKLAPELKRLQEQYKNDRQTLAAKQMEMYKKHGVNPVGGCLPFLIQMPMFLALYQAFVHSAELRGNSFLWINDLTLPDQLFYLGFNWPFFGGPATLNLLPLVYLASSLFMMFSNKPAENLDPDSQQAQMMKMMRWMPVIFVVIFYNMPAGMVLYFTTNSLLTAAESRWIKYRLNAAESKA